MKVSMLVGTAQRTVNRCIGTSASRLPSRFVVNTLVQKRGFAGAVVDENSFAADALKANGEKLVKTTETHVYDSADLKKPSDRVKQLTNEILSLNVFEVNQLMHDLQVCCGGRLINIY